MYEYHSSQIVTLLCAKCRMVKKVNVKIEVEKPVGVFVEILCQCGNAMTGGTKRGEMHVGRIAR